MRLIWIVSLISILVLCSCPHQSSQLSDTVQAALDVIKLAKDVVIGIAKAWDLVDEHVEFSEVPFPLLDRTQEKLFARISVINEKMDRLGDLVDSVGTSTIAAVLENMPQRTRFELRLNNLLDYTTRINVFYRSMNLYVNNRNDFERLTLEDYAKTVVSTDPSSVASLVERIHSFVVPVDTGITNTGIMDYLLLFPGDLKYGLEMMESVWSWALMHSHLRKIYSLYETFRRFQQQQAAPRIPSPKQAWLDLANGVLYDINTRVNETVKELEDNIGQVFEDVNKEAENDMRCSTSQSPQQVLYNLYNTIALTELKGYAMIQFSYMLLRLYGNGNFTNEAQLMKDRFQERTNEAIKAIGDIMTKSSRQFYKCDPKRHVKDETYVELTQLLQGFVQNEVDLNPSSTCRANCAEYSYTKSHGCFENLFCRQQRPCNGRIIDCKFFDSDMWICLADPTSGRRYEYIEYENGRVLGRKQGCHRGTTKVDSWWRWLFWHCSYCFCLCDESGYSSDRYFNMRPTFANITYNKVITGLRFVKNNRIIHLQIQEGLLLPRGKIDPSTVRWVPVDNYKITDRHVFNGQDFHTMNWEKRALDLDDLEADEGHVVTGVRFKQLGSHLNFEIYVTPFDFVTGQLMEPLMTSTWKDNLNTDASYSNPRTRVPLRSPDVPTRSLSPSEVDSKSDQYIEFTNTDIERDAAQTTVPFLDAQNVESLQPVPLSGAGLYHKGRPYFGGFVAPKIITYDFSKHLEVAFPEENIEPDVN